MKPEDYTVDKSKWGDGEWMKEPDRLDWEHEGMTCMALRHPLSGHWCGYVGVPPSHPWHGKDYNDCNVEVHGGLTYGAACKGNVCHTPKPGEPAHLWWLGFDCAHSGDLSPGYDSAYRFEEYASYKSLDYVKHVTEHLAVQVKEVATTK